MSRLRSLTLHVVTPCLSDGRLAASLAGITPLTRLEVDLTQARLTEATAVDLLDHLAAHRRGKGTSVLHPTLVVNGWLNTHVRGDRMLEALGRWQSLPAGVFGHVRLQLYLEDVSLTCAGVMALGALLRSRVLDRLSVEVLTNDARWDPT